MLCIILKSLALHFKAFIHSCFHMYACMNVHISGGQWGYTKTRRGYPLSSLFICSPEAGVFCEPGTHVFCRVNGSMSQGSSPLCCCFEVSLKEAKDNIDLELESPCLRAGILGAHPLPGYLKFKDKLGQRTLKRETLLSSATLTFPGL